MGKNHASQYANFGSLLNERCLECSICAMFFNLSLTVSIKALLLSRILSAILISKFFILFLTLVTSWITLRKRFSNRAWQIYSLAVHSFPLMFSKNLHCFNGLFIYVSRREHKIENITLVIDFQMQFESKEPSHWTFSTFGKSLKCLINQVFLGYKHIKEWSQQTDTSTGSQ